METLREDLGNEYLAQMMMQENVETLNNYGVKKIVTACPHCFHSLKNEYHSLAEILKLIIIHWSLLIDLILMEKSILNKELKTKTLFITIPAIWKV